MKVGDVVKCIYDFAAETETDLGISTGDLIKVTKLVNDDWSEGICNSKKGQFPNAFVEPSNEMFDVGIAISTFEAQQEGDLALLQGEFVVISEKIDENWYSGYTHGGSKGVFPVNFIQLIDFNGSNTLQTDAPSDQITEPNVTWYDIIENFSAADKSELDLVKGTSVKVLSYVDDFWCHGETEDGKQGIFPKSFINIEVETVPSNDKNHIIEDESETSPPLSTPVVSPVPPQAEISPPPPQEILKAKALYTFTGTEKGDLSFIEGDEVFILEKIDESWFRGQNGPDIGIFPSNFVSIIKEDGAEEVNVNAAVNIAETIASPVKKKKPPGRPKPPVIKKVQTESSAEKLADRTTKPDVLKQSTKPVDQSKPFSYYFTTESQPTVIIPSRYAKQGFPNVVVFSKNKDAPSEGFPSETAISNYDDSKTILPNNSQASNFSTNIHDTFHKTQNTMKEESQKLKTKGSVIGKELKSINKNLPNDDMSTFQQIKSANSNLNSVVKISNEVGIKTTKKEVLKNAAKIGAAGYVAGSKPNKPALPTKSFKLK